MTSIPWRYSAPTALFLAGLYGCASAQPTAPLNSARGAAECRKPAAPSDGISAITVQGDTGVGRRRAFEFLNGCTSGCSNGTSLCQSRPGLHIPRDWEARQIQLDTTFKYYLPFFLDEQGHPGENDTDPQKGLEPANVIFYVGEGALDHWTAFKKQDVLTRGTSLGDHNPRYLWILGCQVMAHGPKKEAFAGEPSSVDYPAPQRFDPTQLSWTTAKPLPLQANAFLQWGQFDSTTQKAPLHPNLRLACGGSTVIGGGVDFPTAHIWYYKLITGLDVADSFILGLAVGQRVPLCLTRGDAKPQNTPLFDGEFSTDINQGGRGDYLYLQYPVLSFWQAATSLTSVFSSPSSASTLPSDVEELEDLKSDPPPLPVFRVGPTPSPLGDLLKDTKRLDFGFLGDSIEKVFDVSPEIASTLGALGFDPGESTIRWHPGSGATVVHLRPSALPPAAGTWEQQLGRLLQTMGRLAQQLGPPTTPPGAKADGEVPQIQAAPVIAVHSMLIDRVPAKEATTVVRTAEGGYLTALHPEDIHRSLKCVYVRVLPQVVIKEVLKVSVVGEGSEILLLKLCPREFPDSKPLGLGDVKNAVGNGKVTLTFVKRQIGEPLEEKDVPVVRRRKDALDDAFSQLAGGRRSYNLSRTRLAYRVAPTHCAQDLMYPVYQFDFVRKGSNPGLPSTTIEIPVHDLKEPLEASWKCDPRDPEG